VEQDELLGAPGFVEGGPLPGTPSDARARGSGWGENCRKKEDGPEGGA